MALSLPDAVSHLPALSLGLAVAVAIPLVAIGGVFWWSGQKLMKPLIACAAGCVGALIGLAVAALLQNNVAMIFLPLAGLGVGVAMGLLLFRVATALVAGAMTFMLAASLGSSMVLPKDFALPAPQEVAHENPATQDEAPATHDSGALSLHDLATESIARAKAAAASRPAQTFDAKHAPSTDAGKEYVDVRQLRVGDNPLAVEEVRVDSGHRHLVIRSGPTPEERKKLDEQQTSPLAKLKLDGASGLFDQFKSDAGSPDLAAKKFAALLGGAGVGTDANLAASQLPVRLVLIVLALAASLATTAFGLALWQHRPTVAIVAAGLGSGFIVSGVSIVLFTAKPEAAWLTGLTSSLLFAGLWFALTALGAFSQVRRARAVQLDEAGGVAGTIRTKPVAAPAPKRKITRIPPAKKAA